MEPEDIRLDGCVDVCDLIGLFGGARLSGFTDGV